MTLEQDPPRDQPQDTMPEPPTDPRATPLASPTPASLALDNARGGRWAMNEYFDGLVWLGADGRPVMRRDGSRVGFYFHDAIRLAEKLARDEGVTIDPRRALAPLDAGLPDDWDPQIQKSYLATMTKMTRLMAYDYVRTTEPEEAVRKAVATIFGNPRFIDEPGMKVWVPGKYDVEAVKSVAAALRREALGREIAAETKSDAPTESIVIYDLNNRHSGDETNPSVVKVVNLLTRGEGKIVANRGPKAAGSLGGRNPQAEHYPLHFHIELGDGRLVRVLTTTFEFYPGDEKVATDKHRAILKGLDDAERWFLKRATRDVFYEGSPSGKTMEGFTKRKLGIRRSRGDQT